MQAPSLDSGFESSLVDVDNGRFPNRDCASDPHDFFSRMVDFQKDIAPQIRAVSSRKVVDCEYYSSVLK